MKKLLIIFIFIFPSISFSEITQFDSTVSAGIKQIYDIKFNQAQITFGNLSLQYPKKPQGQFFLAMIDWWKILLNPDNESYDDIFITKLDDVINLCDKILDKYPNNIDALFFKGGAIGFRGRLRAFRESWLKAADDGRLALPIVEKAAKLDSNNVDVQLGFGIYDYFAATIPEKYPFIKPVMLFFPSGNKKKGLEELKNVALHGKYAKFEARYFLMTLYYNYEDDPKNADKWAKMLVKDFPDNPVFERWEGRILAKKGNYFKASKIFKDVLNKANKKLTGYNFPGVKREASYYVGFQFRNYGKLDSAKHYFRMCVELSKQIDKKEASGFIINSYLYLGMINDQQGKRQKAVEYYKKLLEMREYQHSHFLAKKYLKKAYNK